MLLCPDKVENHCRIGGEIAMLRIAGTLYQETYYEPSAAPAAAVADGGGDELLSILGTNLNLPQHQEDTLQGLLMGATAILLPIAAVSAVGGPEGFVDGLRAVSTPEQLSLTGGTAGLVALVPWLAIGLLAAVPMAVRLAVEEGEIPAARYDTYLRLLKDQER